MTEIGSLEPPTSRFQASYLARVAHAPATPVHALIHSSA
jgi:hypothetical protein